MIRTSKNVNSEEAFRQVSNSLFSKLLVNYLRSPDHPMKGRIERLLLNVTGTTSLQCQGHYGINYDASPFECVQSTILRHGCYEPGTLSLLRKLLREGSTFVDVGANVGAFSLSASDIVGAAGRIYAIEPSPCIYNALIKNIKLNNFTNIVPLLMAVSKINGIVSFEALPQDNWGMNRRVASTSQHGVVNVASITLASILKHYNAQNCDVVKIDVEGMELEVLQGLDFDAGIRPHHIIVEYIPSLQSRMNYAAGDLPEFLEKSGYELKDINGKHFVIGEELEENNLLAVDKLQNVNE